MSLPQIELPARSEPYTLHWPSAGKADGFVRFDEPLQWRAFVEGLSLDPLIPAIVRRKYERAQKLYLLGWIDTDLIKAGELVALTALELALNDRYGGEVKPVARRRIVSSRAEAMMASPPRRSFKALLQHMVVGDGLTDDQIPMIASCGGTAIGQLTGVTKPTLDERRNALAHGDPFDGLPTSGLIELVRDLIMFAYRRYLAEAHGMPSDGARP
ncbi:hypothetical protein KRZ98_17390 [Sphingobium sp. AS12]|uniref:hypothetical protein n=1 Tax=Sphingobium sp. AS12 TaxID=2849495 RepID=UPI001C316906|nr:hypothetical protein [Sphingobium sp. AS12]MBV2150020.1 hypothetical protein [Sphingobium sp. AS12]